MTAINLFGCSELNMGGLKRLKLASQDINANTLTYPLDITLKSGDESIIVLSDDETNKIITIGSTQIKYVEMPVEATNFLEEEVLGRQGRFYKETLNLIIPKATILKNNTIKELFFDVNGNFDANAIIVFIEDMNGNYWFSGYDIPLSLISFDVTTDNVTGENRYLIQYASNSYQRARSYELI